MKRKPSSKLILIALDKSITSRTKKLRGILKAADESGMIDLKIMDEGRDLSPEFVDLQASLGVQAFIVGASGVSSGVSRICESRIPVVTISQPYRLWERSCAIHTDNAALSREAARILTANRQTDSFAYFPALGNPQWSTERAEAFAREIARRRPRASMSVLDPDTAADELRRCRKPVGVLAANDTYAAEVLKAAEETGLDVPRDVSIVGIDNEQLLCESLSTPITSIEPDFEREGYEAMRAAIGLLAGKRVARRIHCGISKVIARSSTYNSKSAETLVSRALEVIEEKATSGLTVSDLCAHLRVSRCLLDMRFREQKKRSPKELIIMRRLETLKTMLQSTDIPIAEACSRCGFGSENHPKKLFLQRFGTTMREWRRQKQS
jgi:LacI family transcriptional regulator